MAGIKGMKSPKRLNKRISLPEILQEVYTEEEYNSFSRYKRYTLRNPEKRAVINKKVYKNKMTADPEYNKKQYWGTKKSKPEVQREWHLNFKFGISHEQYMEMFNRQNGLCEICGNKETAKLKNGPIKWLAVDHDHVTGKIRNLLCQQCNNMLGYAKDDPQILLEAAEYLRRWKNVRATGE